MPKIRPGSSLHRWLRITPGSAPRWLCSHDSCIGLDLFGAVPAILFGAAWAASGPLGWWVWPAALVLTVVLVQFVWSPFEKWERRGRARRRRRECVACGQPETASGPACGCFGRGA